MKKTFKLNISGKDNQRVVESIKNEVRKYIKRERKKKLPEDVDYWDFNCKFAADNETHEVIHISDIIRYIDESSKNNCQEFYLEILSKPGYRTKKDIIV